MDRVALFGRLALLILGSRLGNYYHLTWLKIYSVSECDFYFLSEICLWNLLMQGSLRESVQQDSKQNWTFTSIIRIVIMTPFFPLSCTLTTVGTSNTLYIKVMSTPPGRGACWTHLTHLLPLMQAKPKNKMESHSDTFPAAASQPPGGRELESNRRSQSHFTPYLQVCCVQGMVGLITALPEASWTLTPIPNPLYCPQLYIPEMTLAKVSV